MGYKEKPAAPKPPEPKPKPEPEPEVETDDVGPAPVDHELDDDNAFLDEAERRAPGAFAFGKWYGENFLKEDK
jgi:hypothetical protein